MVGDLVEIPGGIYPGLIAKVDSNLVEIEVSKWDFTVYHGIESKTHFLHFTKGEALVLRLFNVAIKAPTLAHALSFSGSNWTRRLGNYRSLKFDLIDHCSRQACHEDFRGTGCYHCDKWRAFWNSKGFPYQTDADLRFAKWSSKGKLNLNRI